MQNFALIARYLGLSRIFCSSKCFKMHCSSLKYKIHRGQVHTRLSEIRTISYSKALQHFFKRIRQKLGEGRPEVLLMIECESVYKTWCSGRNKSTFPYCHAFEPTNSHSKCLSYRKARQISKKIGKATGGCSGCSSTLPSLYCLVQGYSEEQCLG